MMPLGSELYAKKKHELLAEGMKRLQKYTFIVMVPIALGLFAFSKLFIKIFFGNDFIPGSSAMKVLLIGVIFFAVAKINNSVIAGIGKPEVVAKTILIAAIVNIIAIPILSSIVG